MTSRLAALLQSMLAPELATAGVERANELGTDAGSLTTGASTTSAFAVGAGVGAGVAFAAGFFLVFSAKAIHCAGMG